MALPHLKSTFYIQKQTYESNLAKRRNFEEDYRKQWSDKVNYFRKSEINSNKISDWSSEKSYNNSIEAYKKNTLNCEDRNIHLQQRRRKLSELFDKERNEYQVQLENELLSKNASVTLLKGKAERLKSAREEERKKEADRLFYEHFRVNNPDLRKIETELIKEDVVNYWPQQIQLKAEERDQLKQEELDNEEVQSARQKLEEDEAKERFQKRVLKERYLKDSLKRQIDEIKKKEEEAKMLKVQEARLLRMEQEMDEYDRQKKLLSEAKGRQEYGRALLRQHTAVMRRKSQQIQEELESDIRFLSYLADRDEQENEVQTNRKNKVKADILWMQESIEDQLRKEREREAELDSIFAEEAAKLWSKRENEWAKEKYAREKLMEEVLNERKLQVQQKVMETRDKQTRSLRERERILQEIEREKLEIEKEMESARHRKNEFRLILDDQKSARNRNKINEEVNLQNDMQTEKEEELAYEQFLREEARRMRINGITPRSGRR